MSSEIEILLEHIKEIEETHPNVYNLWRVYLTKKNDDMASLQNRCNMMLQLCKTTPDPSINTLLSLTVLNIT